MEENDEEREVAPELYFLIAKFLSGGPLRETAQTMLKELERAQVLPRRLDWEGRSHNQTYHELESQYGGMSWRRLLRVCERALRLARAPPPAPRLSLLSDALVAPPPTPRAAHALPARVAARAQGLGPAAAAGGRGGPALFPARALRSLQLQRRTLGHLSAVYCLAFDRTGRYVLTGADDLLVKAWSALDGRLLATFRGAAAEITDVCVSPDNRLLAAGSVERLVRVWCLATGAPVAVLSAHAGTITSVHFRPARQGDLHTLASTSTDGSVAFWTYRQAGPGGKPAFLSAPVQYVERMRPGACHMICAAWSAGGAFLAAGSADHHVRVYALHDSGPRRVLEVAAHADAVDSLCWAHGALRFVSGSKDGTAALWALHATQWRHTRLRCDEEGAPRLKVTMVCWDRSDALVLTAVSDCSVRVWCARSGRLTRVLRGHTDEAYVLEAHPYLAGVVLSAGHDGQLLVWEAAAGEQLAAFRNTIEGQGAGALFDAKWGAGDRLAATDSHGHLLLLGLGTGHPLLRDLPTELFFHTDYRPVARDALGGAVDEQTEVPPHLMPPPFLVDVEGAPHPPRLQRLVPGREKLTLSQLIPLTDEPPRSRLDDLIEALARGEEAPDALEAVEARAAFGVWRGEGVRHTAGSWQRGDPLDAPHSRRPLVPPLPPAQLARIDAAQQEMYAAEVATYRREMRRRPLMISTAEAGAPHGPRRKPGRARRQPAPRPRPRPQPEPEPEPEPELSSDESSASSARAGTAGGSRRPRRARRAPAPPSAAQLSTSDRTATTSSSQSSSSSSSSSECSDWVAETSDAPLAPPARARRRPVARQRYSPSTSTQTKRRAAAAAKAVKVGTTADDEDERPASPSAPAEPASEPELPEAYRPGEWITAVMPRKAPYHPQIGDECLYFRLGHQRYFEAVAEKDLYKVNPRDKPWERTSINECELVKVVGIKYVIKPPRVVSLKLASLSAPPKTFTVKYHDMPDVIDFMVLRQQWEAAAARRWAPGDRFRCIIDDCWWTGVVLEPLAPPGQLPQPAQSSAPPTDQWVAAAAHFLSLRVRWDNGEVERLSPWDLEPIDDGRVPSSPGGALPVFEYELRAALYKPAAHEWPPQGDRDAACDRLAELVEQAMTLAAAEPFSAPVDLARYPAYARLVAYPVDLSTIRARFQHRFYRRAAAAQFDARYIAANAERFNEPHSLIVRQARLITDLLLHTIANWRTVDLLYEYRRLAASYRSGSEDKPAATPGRSSGGRWRAEAGRVLRELLSSGDADPFRAPVSAVAAPDYAMIVARPMDLGTVMRRLEGGEYASPARFAADVRLVFANSRLYNTNKRSRIYSMTVRLSALFEALWSRANVRERPARRAARRVRRPPSATSDDETLAATSRRVHAAGVSGQPALLSHTPSASSDSDVPLTHHTKGKGIGKKSRNTTSVAPSDDTSADRAIGGPSHSSAAIRPGPLLKSLSGSGTDSGGEYENIEVLEEELVEDDVELAYEMSGPSAEPRARRRARAVNTQVDGRKRRRMRSGSTSFGSGQPSGGRSDSGESWRAAARPAHRKRKRRKPNNAGSRRVRSGLMTPTSSSSTSWSSGGAGGGGAGAADAGARRYESDHSYRPRYSSDDDAPLHIYRQRQDNHSDRHTNSGAGARSRRQLPATRYNEDSEEDSAAAISKRIHHHHIRHELHASRRRALAERMRRGGGVGGAAARGAPGAAYAQDHNYLNGHAHHAASAPAAHSSHRYPDGVGTSSGVTGHARRSSDELVSVSSRGRVRRLTAKARGLLND